MTFELLSDYSYLLIGIGLVLLDIVLAYRASRRDSGIGRRSFWEYFFLWPLLFPPRKQGDKPASNNRFIVGGLIVMVLLIIGSIVIHPAVR